jgi:hypothetical protein
MSLAICHAAPMLRGYFLYQIHIQLQYKISKIMVLRDFVWVNIYYLVNMRFIEGLNTISPFASSTWIGNHWG